LSALAEIGLGPGVLICDTDFFVRSFLPGLTLKYMPLPDLEHWLPEVLKAIDRMCGSGIFHTDPNAGNVIIDKHAKKIGFIDSEIPARIRTERTLSDEDRRFCHERLLYTLSRDWMNRGLPSSTMKQKILSGAYNYYNSTPCGLLTPQRAVDLLTGKEIQTGIPK